MLIWELSAPQNVSLRSASDAVCDFGKSVTQTLPTLSLTSAYGCDREEGTLAVLVVVLHAAELGLQPC